MLLHVIDDPVYWSATWIIVQIIFFSPKFDKTKFNANNVET